MVTHHPTPACAAEKPSALHKAVTWERATTLSASSSRLLKESARHTNTRTLGFKRSNVEHVRDTRIQKHSNMRKYWLGYLFSNCCGLSYNLLQTASKRHLSDLVSGSIIMSGTCSSSSGAMPKSSGSKSEASMIQSAS